MLSTPVGFNGTLQFEIEHCMRNITRNQGIENVLVGIVAQYEGFKMEKKKMPPNNLR